MRGGPSVGTGPVPGQTASGQPAGRGGVGGPGTRGAAGRGNSEEDQEHRRKYLIEPDGKEWRQAEPHPILATTTTWYEEDTMRALDRHALDELEENQRLRRGRPDEDLDDTIGALVRPDREFYGWITTTVDGRPFRYGVLAIAAYQEAVLVVRNYETDATVRPRELAGEFLAQLPALAPAAGQPVRTAYEDFLAATEPEGDGFAGVRHLAEPGDVGDQCRTQPATHRWRQPVRGRPGRPPRRPQALQAAGQLPGHRDRPLAHPARQHGGGHGRYPPPGQPDLIAARLADAERQLSRSE